MSWVAKKPDAAPAAGRVRGGPRATARQAWTAEPPAVSSRQRRQGRKCHRGRHRAHHHRHRDPDAGEVLSHHRADVWLSCAPAAGCRSGLLESVDRAVSVARRSVRPSTRSSLEVPDGNATATWLGAPTGAGVVACQGGAREGGGGRAPGARPYGGCPDRAGTGRSGEGSLSPTESQLPAVWADPSVPPARLGPVPRRAHGPRDSVPTAHACPDAVRPSTPLSLPACFAASDEISDGTHLSLPPGETRDPSRRLVGRQPSGSEQRCLLGRRGRDGSRSSRGAGR